MFVAAMATAYLAVQAPQLTPVSAAPTPGATERALFVRTRLIVLPSFIFSRYLRSYSNALCRANPGKIAEKRGINRTDTCNGSVELGLRWRHDNLWIEASAYYSRLAMPQSNWVAQGEDIGAADLTQMAFNLAGVSLGLVREYSLGSRLKRWRWHLGGQLGLALLQGHLYRTKLGAQPSTCGFDDLGNLSVCRPFRAVEFNEPERNPRFFAACTRDRCSAHDLQRAGRTAEALPRFVPLLGISTGPKVWIHPRAALRAELGFGLGYFFGLGLDLRLPPPVVRTSRIEK